jgi:hypothetical protein
MMGQASVEAANLIKDLSSLAQRLAERDIVVSSLHVDWGTVWTLVAQQGAATDKYLEARRGPNPLLATGPDVLRCSWDNRDNLLAVDRSPTRTLSSPNFWTRETSRACYSNNEAMGWAEKFLSERLG